jgi:RND family efflux transporter, MFP subunit
MTNDAPRKARKWSWKRIIGLILSLVIIGAIIAVFVARSIIVPTGPEITQLEQVVVPVERRSFSQIVQVNGKLEPRERLSVSFPDNVRVTEVLVREGDHVTKDQILARLETRDLELKVASARAQLDQAQQAYEKLEAGPTAADLAAAAAAVASARADIASNASQIRAVDIENARVQLEIAQERLRLLESGELTDEQYNASKALTDAEKAIQDAEINLQKVRDSASLAKTNAEIAMQNGAQALERAQRAYSDAKQDWDYVQRTGRDPRAKTVDAEGREVNAKLDEYGKQDYYRKLEDARVAMQNAERDLEMLIQAYDQAREDEVLAVQEAERAIETAKRNLADAQRSANIQNTTGRTQSLLEARKAVADAQKAYNDLVADPKRPATREQLEAALLKAIADEEKLKAGPDPVELARARTEVEQARAALATAEADLEAATLRAPMTGTVVANSLKVGTITSSSTKIEIADISSFLIKGQVNENNVAIIKEGMPVTVTLDSIPGEEFRASLLRVSDLPSEDNQDMGLGGSSLGGVYPVEILLDISDERLRVGMASTASIEVSNTPDSLIIPLQAVQYNEQGSYVRKVVGEAGPDGVIPTEEVPVELGEISGDSVQILSGLEEGDSVLLEQLPMDEIPMMMP